MTSTKAKDTLDSTRGDEVDVYLSRRDKHNQQDKKQIRSFFLRLSFANHHYSDACFFVVFCFCLSSRCIIEH